MHAAHAVAVEGRIEIPKAAERVYSVDAFRGMTMLWMISEGFGLSAFRSDPVLGGVAYQFTHQDWIGMTAWDLIQPFFMFIVGVAMPFAFARRWEAGESWRDSLRHVLKRGAMLILLGLLARSIQANRPVVDLINVLAQIAFTYFVAFLLLRKSPVAQAGVALGLLAVHWALYQFFPWPGAAGPWVKDANFGSWLDMLVLGKNWRGSYATINCLSSAANTIFGVMAGRLLFSDAQPAQKLKRLAVAGLVAVAAGLALHPVVPVIKKVWTPSFALLSTGITLWALALFFWACDVKSRRGWAKLFVIVGSNSIFIYVFHEILGRWMRQTAPVFTGWAVRSWGPWGEVFTASLIVAFQVYVCWWLWRRRIFLKV